MSCLTTGRVHLCQRFDISDVFQGRYSVNCIVSRIVFCKILLVTRPCTLWDTLHAQYKLLLL